MRSKPSSRPKEGRSQPKPPDLAALPPTSDGRARWPTVASMGIGGLGPLSLVVPHRVVTRAELVAMGYDEGVIPKPSAKGRRVPGTMNKTEARYAAILDSRIANGEVAWWAYEAWKVKIGEGAWYLPDFAVMLASGQLEFHETKGGFAREAALVRFKAAASLYPVVLRWCVYTKGEWTITTPFPDDR